MDRTLYDAVKARLILKAARHERLAQLASAIDNRLAQHHRHVADVCVHHIGRLVAMYRGLPYLP